MFDMMKAWSLGSDALKWIGDIKKEKRENLAKLCDSIGELLTNYVKMSSDQRQSIQLCGELSVYVGHFQKIAEGLGQLETEEINKMSESLNNVCKVMQAKQTHEFDLDEVWMASGYFRGLATVIRLM